MSDSFDEMRKIMRAKKNSQTEKLEEKQETGSESLNFENIEVESSMLGSIEDDEHLNDAKHKDNTITKQSENKFCPNCRNKCKDEDAFCNKYGAKLPKQESNQTKLYCNVCGTENNESDIYCKECGTNLRTNEAFATNEPKSYNINFKQANTLTKQTLDENIQKCPFCGSEVQVNIMKCPHCGEWLRKKKPLGCYNILSWTIFIISLFTAWGITEDFTLGLLWAIGIVVALWIYFIPSWVAELRKHRNSGAIFAVNLFLGETVIGWIIALIWALCG